MMAPPVEFVEFTVLTPLLVEVRLEIDRLEAEQDHEALAQMRAVLGPLCKETKEMKETETL